MKNKRIEEMSRYIDADKLKQDLIHNRSFYPAIVKSAIENAPTADVVEVVRCENCRHYHAEKGGWCERHDFEFDVGDYCSYGERREE